MSNAEKTSIESAVKYYKKGDYKSALRIFQRYAKKGNLIAKYNLAMMYKNGRGVKKNKVKYLKLLIEPAQKEIPSAYYELGGEHILEGERVSGTEGKRSKSIGAKMLRGASNLGHPDAQHWLGNLFARGEGFEKNIFKALTWLKISSDNGNQMATKDFQKLCAKNKLACENALRQASEMSIGILFNKTRYPAMLGIPLEDKYYIKD